MDEWLEQFARANFRRGADTAHDLKTPLNVAVLNLELMRMRLGKLSGDAIDDKVAGYAAAIETELRRLGRIFDAFFLLATPPNDEGAPAELDIASLAREVAARSGYDLPPVSPAIIEAHASRMQQMLKLLFDSASKLFPASGRSATGESADGRFTVAIAGKPEGDAFEVEKIFKLYYTDPSGSPDPSLAAARLIAETYGGELTVVQNGDRFVLRLSFPLGAR